MSWIQILLVGSGLVCATAWAGTRPFQILKRSSDLLTTDQAQYSIRNVLQIASDSLENSVNNTFLSEASRAGFDDSLGRANASNMSSLVMDRGSSPRRLSVGLGAQAAIYAESSEIVIGAENALPRIGASAQTGLMVGLNADMLGLARLAFLEDRAERLTLYLSGFYLSTNVQKFSVKAFNLGLNGQYRAVPRRYWNRWIDWGGVDVASGINFTSSAYAYTAKVTAETRANLGSETAAISVDLDYSLGIKSTNFQIPFEVSTNMTFFYFLTLYSGVALDANFGSSRLTGKASGPIRSSYTGTVTVGNLYSAEANLDLDDEITGRPSVFLLRGFTGVQLNLWKIRVATEGYALTNGAYGLAALVRFAI